LINIPGALPAIFELTFNHSLAAGQQPASFAVVFLINRAIFSDSFYAWPKLPAILGFPWLGHISPSW